MNFVFAATYRIDISDSYDCSCGGGGDEVVAVGAGLEDDADGEGEVDDADGRGDVDDADGRGDVDDGDALPLDVEQPGSVTGEHVCIAASSASVGAAIPVT